VLALLFADRPVFSAPERELMTLLATQSAVALGNARRFAATEQGRVLASSVAELGRLAAGGVEPLELAGAATRWARRLLGARFAVLLRWAPDSPSGVLSQLAVAGELDGWLDSRVLVSQVRALVAMALLDGAAAVTPDLAAEPRAVAALRRHDHLARAGYHSVLAVPVTIAGHVAGVIAVGDHPGRPFVAGDVEVAGRFADLAAPMLERVLGREDEPVASSPR
jgi:GAF domain-containing protein